MNLEEYKAEIRHLAKTKGWSTDSVWLAYSVFKETGELVSGFEHDSTPEDLAEEFVDIMHFLLQYMDKVANGVDLDEAMRKKIESNYINKKKTYDSITGNIIKK